MAAQHYSKPEQLVGRRTGLLARRNGRPQPRDLGLEQPNAVLQFVDGQSVDRHAYLMRHLAPHGFVIVHFAAPGPVPTPPF